MRKPVLVTLAVLAAAAIAGGSLFVIIQHKKTLEAEQREARYQRVLKEYEAKYSLGTSRETVENNLRKDSASFGRYCCRTSSNKYIDSIEIGREPGSWYCSYWSETIDLEFDGASYSSRDPEDRLRRIRLRTRAGQCL
jgi:hypothetical protein